MAAVSFGLDIPGNLSGVSHLLSHIVSSDERPGVYHQVLHDLLRRLDRTDGCYTGACSEAHLFVIASRLRDRHCTVGWHFVRSSEDDRLAVFPSSERATVRFF
jgi:hypothetical protein